jgi:VWFA-related protein
MAKSAKNRKGCGVICLALGMIVLGLFDGFPKSRAQSTPNQPTEGQNSPQATTQQGQAQDIPDAPTPQASQPEPARPPIAQPEEKPAQPAKNPFTGLPASKPTPSAEDENQPSPPPMPPVRTVPPGSTARENSDNQQKLYTLVVHTNFVQVPVTVKDRDGRMVDGLLPKDFSVVENGTKQQLTFFSSDPFALSVAIVLDLGMPDTAVQKVNQTFPALVGAFAPYDEVSLYTYSSTVSQVSDFNGISQKLTALLNQIKEVHGHNNGVPVLSGPMASGPMVNGIPVGQPTQPVNTPPKEAHVLNDAILRAALDLSKRDRTRRKIIFVISDGREFGSKASYSDVLRLLLSNEIQVKAVAVESAALPIYNKLERLHLPRQGYSNILPKYASATGGAPVLSELSRNAIESVYAQVMGEARNQYTLGYTPKRGDKPSTSAYHSIEVLVDRPNLKIYAKDGYYPAPVAR